LILINDGNMWRRHVCLRIRFDRRRQSNRDAWKMDLVRIVRTIVAVVLAVAVAVMPAAAGALAAAGATPDASTATLHSAAMPDDCAHHHAPGDRDSKGTDHGAALAGCVVHCFTYAGTVVPGISPTPKASPLQPLFDTGRIVSNIAAPPFRPPRV
jgi:hypothetical protein